jgi:hypothetical protein
VRPRFRSMNPLRSRASREPRKTERRSKTRLSRNRDRASCIHPQERGAHHGKDEGSPGHTSRQGLRCR